MIAREILLKERGGVERNGEFVRIGLPFAKGELEEPDGLSLMSPDGTAQPVQIAVLKRWKDNSVKWALFDFAASVQANARAVYRIVSDGGAVLPPAAAIGITPGADAWRVDTGVAEFFVDARDFRPFCRVSTGNRQVLVPDGASCIFSLDGENRLTPGVECVALEAEGPIRATLRLEGKFFSKGDSDEHAPRFVCRLHFFSGSSRVVLEITLHNPRAARHGGGLWDLGDRGSLLFRELALLFPFSAGLAEQIACSAENGIAPFIRTGPTESMIIYQESSGGKNWLSPAHRSRNGQVPFNFRGYNIQIKGKEVARGRRATPTIWCGKGSNGIAAVLPRFWQEFPKAFELDRTGLKIALFPSRFPVLHELQGGERKTTTVYLDFDTSPTGLGWARSPLAAVALPEVYRRSGAIPDLPGGKHGEADLVDRFVAGPEVILEKREAIDEFGWRNFGDLYADHEAVYHQGAAPFVSHYNNQYDVCAGIYRKFFATGDPLWGEAAADLARHVLDIDIYHTDKDREAYNGGLFWHTDHYIPAGLATHRSFSREHLEVKDPRFCGGGPAAEHCYTTGLMLHYFMTGNPDYREAVIALAEWAVRLLAGPHELLSVVRRIGRYVSLMNSVRNSVKPAFPRYPLTRATGNAITACLDAFEVGGGVGFLEQAEELIRGAMHPADDISARDLLNAEDAWSYTVLLVAVVKFLDKKSEIGEVDGGYAYARACLLAYGEWMLRHEYPYLDKPELLEYPNETWPAQDLRKSVIFYHAARFSEQAKRKAFLEAARFFFTAARDELERHPTSSFTRPMALMLQNGWVGARLDEELATAPVPDVPAPFFGKPTPRLGFPAVAARVGWEMSKAIKAISLRREIGLLRARLEN